MRLSPYAAGILAAASIFTVATAPAEAATRRAPAVEIDRIWYDSPGPDYRSPRSLNAEYVVLRNTNRRSTVNLRGWSLSDAANHRYVFRSNTYLRPGQRVTIRTGVGRDTWSTKYQNRRNYVWNNHRDTGTLRDARGRRVDVCSYNNHRADFTNCRNWR